VAERKIAIDTEILIILAGGPTGITDGAARARQAIKDHMAAGEHVYIPAPAYAECCHIQEELMEQMRIPPFNAAAALIANRIASLVKKLPRSRRQTRQELKVDTMILATAESIKAAVLYVGEDDWFRKAAEAAALKVDVRELPELRPEQLPLR